MKALSLAFSTGQATLLAPASLPEVTTRLDGQLWIGIHFPLLALEVCDYQEGLPSIVIDQSGNQQTVHAACAVAMDYGIMPGMSLNAAHTLCRNLDVRLRNPEAEYQQLKKYGEQLLCFTPSVSLGYWRTAASSQAQASKTKSGVTDATDNADTLLLEVSASLKLYDGLDRLLGKITAEFVDNQQNLPLISVAPCPSAALLMARNGMEQQVQDSDSLRSVLGGVLLSGADLPQSVVERLHRCGLRTLRDCWRLPREDLGRRFGLPLLHYLDRLCGAESDAVDHIETPLCFRQRMELPADTRQHHLITLAAEKLLTEAHRFLQMHSAATEQIQFDLWHVNRAFGSRSRTTIVLQTAQADRRPERFLPQLGEQLDRIVMADEVNAVSILVDHVVPYVRSSEDLFERRDRQQQDYHQLMDLLCARLGQKQVYTLAIAPDHRPEYAWRKKPVIEKNTVAGESRSETRSILDHVAQALPQRPLWLLDIPRPVNGESISHTSETERIEAGWWMRNDSRRDYAVLDQSGGRYRGQRRWLFRDLKKRGSQQTEMPAWYVHGLFA